MKESTDYWKVDFGHAISPPYVVEHMVEPDEVTMNPKFNYDSYYFTHAYISGFQSGKLSKRIVGGPVLARVEGGRSLTIAEEDSIFRVGDTNFSVNVKGAGAIMGFLVGYSVKDNNGKEHFALADFNHVNDRINRHFHVVPSMNFYDLDSFAFANPVGSLSYRTAAFVTDRDFDDETNPGVHRPYGGQTKSLALNSLNVSKLSRDTLKMNVCPVVSVVDLKANYYPKQLCSSRSYFNGRWRSFDTLDNDNQCSIITSRKRAQEIRLLPSNVRVRYFLGVATRPFSIYDKQVYNSLHDNGIELDDFRETLTESIKEVLFLPYRTRKIINGDMYRSYDGDTYRLYTHSSEGVLDDTVLDMRGRAYYADLEGVHREIIPRIELLLRMVPLVRQYLSVLLTSEIPVDSRMEVSELFKSAKENHSSRLEAFLSDESYLKLLPSERSAVAHIDIDGGSIDVKYEYSRNGQQKEPIILLGDHRYQY